MVDIILKTLEPADSYDLITLEELKIKLGIPDSDLSQDAMLSQMITSYSDVVATFCNRVFAKEKVRETWRGLDSNRVYLSHYPIADESDIESIECPRGSVMDSSGYEIELKSGKVELFSSQSQPIVITYTGGYELPDESPPALKEVTAVIIREIKAQAYRSGGVRSLVHKESRVMFFDPNQQKAGMTTFSQNMGGLNSTIAALLYHYIRLQV